MSYIEDAMIEAVEAGRCSCDHAYDFVVDQLADKADTERKEKVFDKFKGGDCSNAQAREAERSLPQPREEYDREVYDHERQTGQHAED